MSNSFLQQLSASGLYDTEELVIENSEQLIADLRAYLTVNNMDMALACLDIAIEEKKGRYRKDGKTPSIIHEVSQALYTISLIEDGIYLDDPESVIALNFVHDLGEDFGIKPKILKEKLYKRVTTPDYPIEQLAIDFDLMTKRYKGEEPKFKYEFEYYKTLQESQNASIAKLVDRIHNVATQIGVQSEERCSDYIRNTALILNDYVLYAVRKFPEQTDAYINCQDMLKTLCQISRYYLARAEMGKPLPDHDTLLEEMPNKGFNVPLGLNPISLNGNRIIKEPGWEPEEAIAYEQNMSGILQNFVRRFNLF